MGESPALRSTEATRPCPGRLSLSGGGSARCGGDAYARACAVRACVRACAPRVCARDHQIDHFRKFPRLAFTFSPHSSTGNPSQQDAEYDLPRSNKQPGRQQDSSNSLAAACHYHNEVGDKEALPELWREAFTHLPAGGTCSPDSSIMRSRPLPRIMLTSPGCAANPTPARQAPALPT